MKLPYFCDHSGGLFPFFAHSSLIRRMPLP
jgi:hypothetical protein